MTIKHLSIMVHLVIKKFLPDSSTYEVLGAFICFKSALRFKTKYEKSRTDYVFETGFLSIITLPLFKKYDV